MNLGVVFFETSGEISTAAFWIAVFLTALLRFLKRIRIRWLIASLLFSTIALNYIGHKLFHLENFKTRHQAQNIWVPQHGCITYEPSPGQLFASYTMSSEEFEKWVAEHPFGMSQYDLGLMDSDSVRLGFSEPEAAYATEMAPNGKQLRVYYKNGRMYLSYNVM